MSILKKGVRFNSQDTGAAITGDEIPFIVMNLTPSGMKKAAFIGFQYMKALGFSIDKALEVMGSKQEGEEG
jgi:hypothetical protein